jgi:serine/threonine protein kinase
MQRLKASEAKGFVELIDHGSISNNKCHYLVMNKLGPNLRTLFRKNTASRFSTKTIVQLGLQMTERIRKLHELGYLHMDIKPDNILLGTTNLRSLDSSNIHLIDFGISKSYLTPEGEHIPF